MSKKTTPKAGRPPVSPGEKVQKIGVTLRPSQITHAENRASLDFGGNLSRYFQHLVDADMTGATSPPLEQRVERLEAAVFPKAKPPQ